MATPEEEIRRALAQQARMFGGPIAGVTGGPSTTGEMPPEPPFGLSALDRITGATTPRYSPESGFDVAPPASRSAPYYTDITNEQDAERRRRFQESMTAAKQPAAADWQALIEALGGMGAGGGYTPVSVDRSLFRMAETPEEQALLARELADIDARRTAGVGALSSGWAQVARTNAAAAEKARAEVARYGPEASATWMDAAARAEELAEQRAQQAGQFAGRQSISISPSGGAEDFIAFMQAQAPAAQQYAERTQETLASDLDWMAGLAGAQGQAYQGELTRQAAQMAFQSAREHNRAVLERINAERMALAQMEFDAARTNAQLAQAAQQSGGASELRDAVTTALLYGDAQGPAVLASLLGVDASQALSLYNSAKSSPLGISLLNQAANPRT